VSRLKDAAIRHQWAAKEADLAYSDLIAECVKAHNAGVNIKQLSYIAGISRMTLHKHISAAIADNLRASQDD
jgi:ribosomal protein L20